MDIKAKINEVTDKVKSDPEFTKKLKENPVKAVEDVTGIDLPEEQVNKVISDVKAKVNDPEFTKKLKENPVQAVKDQFLGGKK